MIRIFIGYDRREAFGFQVLAHSIISRASEPVSITPIALQNLGALYERKTDPLQSTEFSFSRFFAPYLAGYAGWAIFMDCDCLCLD
ncbi:MAG: glycosyltransferase, partial [Alphaproteobacteria bacterium]|nr:glycosyltransferase [Alphaproteobacteria bacterium]